MYAQRQPSYLQTGDDININWTANKISEEEFDDYMEHKSVSLYKEPVQKTEIWKDAWDSPAYMTDDIHEEYSKYGLKFTGNLAKSTGDGLNDF